MAATTVVSPSAARPPERPMAVTVVVALALAVSVYLIVVGALALRDAGDGWRPLAEAAFEIALGLLALAIAIGAWGVKPWAWKLFMAVAVAGLTSQLLRYFAFGDPSYARMAVHVFVVFALTPRDVQVAFRIRPPANVDLAQSTRNPLDRH
jgi:hypothetical protein